MYQYIIAVLFFFFFSFLIAKKLNFYDYPDKRKMHLKPTMNLGGVAIILSLISAVYLFEFSYHLNLIIIFCSYFAILGFIDDKISINPYYRIIIQIIIISYFLHKSELYITHISLNEKYAVELGSFSEIFTILCIMIMINSLNYFDGIDLNLIFIVLIFMIIFYFKFRVISSAEFWIFITPMILFAIMNSGIPKIPKMFLGDNGSNCLGFLVAVLLLLYNKQDGSSFLAQHQIMWLTSIIVYEFLSINISRINRKISIFKPGIDHLHYILNNTFKNKIVTVILISSLMIILFYFGQTLIRYQANISFYMYVINFLVYFVIREKLLSKKIILS